MKQDLNLIPVFIAIFEELNLSKAAARLSVSQPAISKSLNKLRQSYNDQLFYRCKNGVTPTSLSEYIYPTLSSCYSDYMSTICSSSKFDLLNVRRTFTIGCISGANYDLIPALVEMISFLSPNISLEICPISSKEHYTEKLRLQKFDLVIDLHPGESTFLDSRKLLDVELVVGCSCRHPRLTGNTMTKEEYFYEDHVSVYDWAKRAHLFGSNVLSELSRRKIAYTATSMLDILPVISNSEMISIIPASVLKKFSGFFDLKMLPIPINELSTISLYILWHPNRNEDCAHIWLRQVIKNCVQTMTTKENTFSYKEKPSTNFIHQH
ncbi:LysR family transcriptional regulator [Vibrio fluvialis]|nr:LysR family transcriptional regulator [Vibrio fluvialis]